MPWKPPANFGGLNFRGRAVRIDKRGFVELSRLAPDVASALVGELPSHGFVAMPDAAADPDPAPAAASDEANAAPQDEPGFDPAAATAEDIGAMNRNELFAFLREHNVSAQPPITNDDLRALAMAAIAGPPQDPAV